MTDADDQDVTIKALRERCAELDDKLKQTIGILRHIRKIYDEKRRVDMDSLMDDIDFVIQETT